MKHAKPPLPADALIFPDDWARPASPRTVIDCWRVLKNLGDGGVVHLLKLGRGKGFA
jgi:hypothetical protein